MQKLLMSLGLMSLWMVSSSALAQYNGRGQTFSYSSGGYLPGASAAYSSYLAQNNYQHQLSMALIAQAGARQAQLNQQKYGNGPYYGVGRPYTRGGLLKPWHK